MCQLSRGAWTIYLGVDYEDRRHENRFDSRTECVP